MRRGGEGKLGQRIHTCKRVLVVPVVVLGGRKVSTLLHHVHYRHFVLELCTLGPFSRELPVKISNW